MMYPEIISDGHFIVENNVENLYRITVDLLLIIVVVVYRI